MCQELGMLCGAFLVGSSRWNRNAGEEHIIARVSEVMRPLGIPPGVVNRPVQSL